MKFLLKGSLLFLAVAAFQASADTIVLRDGDQFTGSLVEISDDVAVFRTELAGQLILPLVRVASITTAHDVQVLFNDGGRSVGRLVTLDGKMQFMPADGGEAYPIQTAMLASVAPARGETLATADSSALHKDMATVESGVQYTSGNDDFVSLYAHLRLAGEGPRTDWWYDARLASGNDFDDLSLARTAARWHWRPEARLHPALEVSLERNTDELLDLRGTLTVGAYATLWENSDRELGVMAGLTAEADRWNGEALDDRNVFPVHGWDGAKAALYYQTVERHYNDTDVRLDLSLHHLMQVFDRVTWEEELSLYPNLLDGGDWRGAYESSFLFPLTDRLRLNLNLRVDYDSDPAFRYLEEWRTSVGAGIRWTF